MTLSQASGVPYWRQIRDHIADRIRSGDLAPGAPLPSVRQLAADMLVSVITTRKAYDELEAAGLIVSHQGRGSFVSDTATGASRKDLLDSIAADLQAVVRRAEAAGVTRDELRELLGALEGRELLRP